MKNTLLFVYLLMMILLSGCSTNVSNKNIVTISGSDTMFELTSTLAEEYMKENPGFSVKVEGGGTAGYPRD